jgi:pimeloyl-ACP methyl ester carboxylesterase
MLSQEMRDQQISAYDNAQNAEFVARNVLTARALSDDTVMRIVEDMVKGSPAAKAAWPRHAMNEDILELAQSISVRTAIIAGDRDQVEPMARVKSEVVGNIPNTDLAVLEDGGHLALLEVPEEVTDIISTFALKSG